MILQAGRQKKAIKVFVRLICCVCFLCVLSACEKPSNNDHSEDTALQVKANYVGAEVCANCHQESFQEWRQSHHYQAMREADSNSVLADFDGKLVEAHGVKYRFYTQQESDNEDSYWVLIDENQQEKSYQISYTFAYHPLQQYLVKFDNGHIQALNMAWDSRSKQEGGQRWFHLRPDDVMSKDNIFHWERHYQNWNARCADCHSTGLEKNYNEVDNSYATQWSEVNVACEACHGPGSEHIRLVQSDAPESTGFKTNKQVSLDWVFRDGASIASGEPNDDVQSNEVDMCGACHSLRSNLTINAEAESYHDDFRLQVVDETGYFSDGQIKEEVFVLGSFLQSKMHASGVTCANCHNPHSGAVLIEGNGLCLQCHSATAYDTSNHHAHQVDTEGGQCINCHMPARTYMQVDARRDHSFVIPDAELSSQLGAPNPCLTCHQDQDQGWLKENVKTTDLSGHWALVKSDFLKGEDVVAEIKNYLDADHPQMRKAALLTTLSSLPSQQSFDLAKAELENEKPLIRRAALSSLINMPLSVRLPNALKLIDDPVRSVRFEALSLLLADYQQLTEEHKQTVAITLEEYQQSLHSNADSPEGQMMIANLAVSQLNFAAAEAAYQRALNIEPHHIPTLINFADFYRATNRDGLGRDLLKKAVSLAPDNSGASFAYGMSLIRIQAKEEAMQYLKIATEQADSAPYYHYVYAVGLNDFAQLEQARSVIDNALVKWPTDAGLLELSQQLR